MNNTLEKTKKVLDSKFIKTLIYVAIILAVLLATLQIGIIIGYRKAKFSYGMGDNYYHSFGPHQHFIGGMMGGIGGIREDFTSSHGVIGKIVSIDLPTMVILGSDNIEKTVIVSTSTAIIEYHDNLLPTDIKIGDYAMVIGSPNDNSQIEAKFIRVMGDMMQGVIQNDVSGTSTKN